MKKTTGLALALLVLVFSANAQETKYTNNSFARLSYVSGNTYVQRASDLGYEEGVVNTPVAEGDRLGTTNGRAEIYLGNKNYIRLDENTKIDFLSLPKRDGSLIRVRNWAGNIYVDVNALEKEKGIEVLTSDATFYILDRGLYRIDVRENKETEILVFQGVVEAAGENESVLVKKSQKLIMSEGRIVSRPAGFFAGAEDTFDRWNGDRASIINRQLAKRYLSGDLEDYEYELDEYGDWTYVSPFGHVWVPRGLGSDWRPYSFGRWVWMPMAGWTWLPYEPWGWSTFHYGRWHWGLGVGWYWIPTYVWGPAWVNWWWDYDYYGWAPMSYWGYPVYIVDNVFYGQGYHGNDFYRSRALTVVHKNQLQARDIKRISVGQDVIRGLGKIELKEKSLDVRPSAKPGLSIEQADGKKMIMRRGGEAVEMKPATMPGRNIKTQEISGTAGGAAERGIAKSGDKSGSAVRGAEIKREGDSPPPAIQTPPSSERRIRNKTEENLGQGSTSSRPASMTDKVYQRSSGEKSSSISRSSSGKSSSSRVSTSRSAAPRSVSAPSSSRGSSSGGRSSPSRSGGSARKK